MLMNAVVVDRETSSVYIAKCLKPVEIVLSDLSNNLTVKYFLYKDIESYEAGRSNVDSGSVDISGEDYTALAEDGDITTAISRAVAKVLI